MEQNRLMKKHTRIGGWGTEWNNGGEGSGHGRETRTASKAASDGWNGRTARVPRNEGTIERTNERGTAERKAVALVEAGNVTSGRKNMIHCVVRRQDLFKLLRDEGYPIPSH